MSKTDFVGRCMGDQARRKEKERKKELDYNLYLSDAHDRMRRAYVNGGMMKKFRRK